MTLKASLRTKFLAVRAQLSPARREAAAKALYQEFEKNTSARILSFVPFGTEIDLMPINRLFASQGRLALPRSDKNPCIVRDLDLELTTSSLGFLEPKSSCLLIDLFSIELVLVPGLAFDEAGYRLGYGKGFYDQLLKGFKGETIGVGFKEQKSSALLPRDPWDIAVQSLSLF